VHPVHTSRAVKAIRSLDTQHTTQRAPYIGGFAIGVTMDDYIDDTPYKITNPPNNRGPYNLMIYNTLTDNTSYYGFVTAQTILDKVGRYIIGHDFTEPRFHETISYLHLVITIENSTR